MTFYFRSELESQYAKGLSKLSGKLLKASKEAKGSIANAWQAVAVQIDTQAELHRWVKKNRMQILFFMESNINPLNLACISVHP